MGLYNQIVWQYSQGHLAYSSLLNKFDLADRFRPILFFIVPVYKIFPHVKTLLFIQVVMMALAAVPIYQLAKLKTKHEVFALSISFAYLFFIGVQTLMMDDFHELAFLPFFLGWLFYFLETKNQKGYWISFLGALFVREYIGLYLAVIGCYILITRRGFFLATRSIFLGLLWSVVVIFFVMPHLGQREYGGFLNHNQSFSSEIFYLVAHPIYTVSNLVLPIIKVKTTATALLLFLLLPIFYPPILLLIGFQLASRFLDLSHPYRWTLYYHYSGDRAVFLAVGAIYGALRIKRLVLDKFKKYTLQVLAISIFGITILEQIFMSVPSKLLVNRDYFQQKPYMQDINSVLTLIPKDSSVVTQNNLLPHLSQRNKIYLFPNINNSDYVLADLRPGQDSYNFFGFTPEQIKSILDNLVASKQYSLLTKKGDVYLLQRSPK
jgi:uncharacterized membrane protein